MASILGNDTSSELQKDMANFGMAQIARTENNFDYARSLLDQLIEKYPQKFQLIVDKGVLEFEDGQFDVSEKLLRGAIDRNRNDLYAVYTLGLLLQRTTRLESAVKQFKLIERELPQYAPVYFALGQIYSNQSKGGLAHLYLGKYNLYEGKLDLARRNFIMSKRDKSLTEKERENVEDLLEVIEKLKK